MAKKLLNFKAKKFNPGGNHKLTVLLWIIAFASIGGVVALYLTQAAEPLIVDASIPQPRNVQAFGDDRVITVTWEDNEDATTVGYYVTYKKTGAVSIEGVKQAEDNMVQIQPVENGQEYTITVQSARGTYVRYDNTDIGGGSVNQFARANGRVSTAVTTTATPSSARVDAMRQRLTGFFDDFNTPSNPLDETKWNNAAAGCVETNTAGQFINAQFHAHNTVRSGWCDRGSLVTRTRAFFDTSNATESAPAQIEWDMDGVTEGRDTWYLDIVPKDSRKDGTNIDITGHNDMFHSDNEDPGNMLRINPNRGGMTIVYYDTNREAQNLNVFDGATACGQWWQGPTVVNWDACDASQKTGSFSPLAQPSTGLHPRANVRRHWVVQMTPTKVFVYVDNVKVADATLPAAFAAKKSFGIHSNLFSYNTGKDHNPDWGGRAYPYVQMFHWDNFGFTGPAPTTVVHNYIDGGRDGKTPNYFLNNGPTARTERGQRALIIPIPDDIGSPIDDKGTFYFTIQNLGYQQYTWRSGDHILFNGVRYDFPDPRQNMVNPRTGELTGAITPYAATIKINKADIRKGDNAVKFNFVGSGSNVSSDFINVHLELEYAKSGASIPSYTQPVQIFGQAFSRIVEPSLTNCDSYNFIEQDLNLPYLAGRNNLSVGPCVLLNTMPAHNPSHYGSAPTPVPTPDTTPPTVSLTAPANNTSLTGNTVVATAAASDNVAVGSVAFYIGNVLQSTDTSAPYEATLDFTSLAAGSYAVTARAYDASNNSATTSAVTVIKPIPADTTAPAITGFTPANGYDVPAGATSLTLTANVTDAVGVTRVDFFVDSALVATRSTPVSGSTYSYEFNPSSLQAGNHLWRVEARDAAGNVRVSNNWNFDTVTPTTAPDPDPEPTPNPVPTPNPTPAKVGDLTGDGRISFADLALLLASYGKTVPANQNGDLNGSGTVTFADLALLLANYGK